MTGPVALVLGSPHDGIGTAIDAVTGNHGWSHVAVDVGWPGSDPLYVDIDRELGVCLQRRSAIFPAGRATKRIALPERWHEYVRRAIVYRIGEEYSILAMVLQPLQIERIPGTYCSRLVRECLPRKLRALLPACPSPSDLLALEGGA